MFRMERDLRDLIHTLKIPVSFLILVILQRNNFYYMSIATRWRGTQASLTSLKEVRIVALPFYYEIF